MIIQDEAFPTIIEPYHENKSLQPLMLCYSNLHYNSVRSYSTNVEPGSDVMTSNELTSIAGAGPANAGVSETEWIPFESLVDDSKPAASQLSEAEDDDTNSEDNRKPAALPRKRKADNCHPVIKLRKLGKHTPSIEGDNVDYDYWKPQVTLPEKMQAIYDGKQDNECVYRNCEYDYLWNDREETISVPLIQFPGIDYQTAIMLGTGTHEDDKQAAVSCEQKDNNKKESVVFSKKLKTAPTGAKSQPKRSLDLNKDRPRFKPNRKRRVLVTKEPPSMPK